MIAQTLVNEVRHLLATGKYSQREVARRTNVGRGTVNTIARGKRKIHVQKEEVEEWGPFDGPIKRCSTCGGLVHMPCRLCLAQHQMSTTRRPLPEEEDPFRDNDPFLETPPEYPLGLQLKEEDLKRYEEVHQQRLARNRSRKNPTVTIVYPEPEKWELEDERSFEKYLRRF